MPGLIHGSCRHRDSTCELADFPLALKRPATLFWSLEEIGSTPVLVDTTTGDVLHERLASYQGVLTIVDAPGTEELSMVAAVALVVLCLGCVLLVM